MDDRSPNVTWLKALPEAALLTDRAGTVIAVNAHAVELLQTDPSGLPGITFIRAPAFAMALQQLAATGEAQMVDVEFHGRPPRQVSVHLAQLGASGNTLILLRDLTREQAIEKMRSDFVANASHEMRTPLATIIGTIETLQGAARQDVKARDMFLATMLTQAQRMKRLIDDLLTLSRIELNEHVRPNGRVILLHVLKQAKANLAPQALESKVSVDLEGDENIAVTGDADELLQIAQNLLENAIKYGASGGRIEVSCVRQGSDGVFTVRDFGNGIADVHLPRLTERFYRVSTQESRSRGGTGLGLAIVKHIVLRHRGKLDIASRPNQGSAFTISIPLYIS